MDKQAQEIEKKKKKQKKWVKKKGRIETYK